MNHLKQRFCLPYLHYPSHWQLLAPQAFSRALLHSCCLFLHAYTPEPNYPWRNLNEISDSVENVAEMQFAVYLAKQKVQDEEIARLHLNVVVVFFPVIIPLSFSFFLPFAFSHTRPIAIKTSTNGNTTYSRNISTSDFPYLQLSSAPIYHPNNSCGQSQTQCSGRLQRAEDSGKVDFSRQKIAWAPIFRLFLRAKS